MTYSVNQETLVATYNGKEFAPICSDGVHRALTETECAEFKTDIDAWVSEELNRELNFLRQKRNSLIAQTDYLALSDQTMTAEMTAYRQALRDITNGLTTVEDVEAVVFPEKPEA